VVYSPSGCPTAPVRQLTDGCVLEPDKFRNLCVNANIIVEEDNEPVGFLEEESADHIQGMSTNCCHTRSTV
jgi:hypothetical protein